MNRLRIVILLSLRAGLALGLLMLASRPAAAQSSAPPKSDFSAFRIITDRNVFDPRRYARSGPARETRRAARVDTFTLVGTLEYDKGPVAFFDGTSSQFRKAVRPEESIGSFKVADIKPAAVTLVSDTNTFQLKMGSQMRREEEGPWQLAATTELPPLSAPSRGGAGTGPGPVVVRNEPAPGTNQASNAEPQVIVVDSSTGSALVGQPSDAADTNAPASDAGGGGETDPILLRLQQRAAAERGEAR